MPFVLWHVSGPSHLDFARRAALECTLSLTWARMSDEDCLLHADVVKVRMQLHSMQLAGDGRLLAPNPNLVRLPQSSSCWFAPPCSPSLPHAHHACFASVQVRTGVMMVQSEGWAALMSGTSATVARGLFYGGAHPFHPANWALPDTLPTRSSTAVIPSSLLQAAGAD